MNGQVTISLEDFKWLEQCKNNYNTLKRELQNCCIMEDGEHYNWRNKNTKVVDIKMTNKLKKYVFDAFDEEMYFTEEFDFTEELVNEVKNENRKEN